MTKMNSAIEHIVVVMLENRSFDNVLGYLYSPEAPPQRHIPELKPDDKPFYGLLFENTDDLKNDNVPPQPIVRAVNTPGWDPGEEFEHVNVQLFCTKDGPKTDPKTKKPEVPKMQGFLKDYSTVCGGDGEAKKQIMHMYTPADLPVINALAKAYAVSDEWFASVPTQTNANRAFSLCGTSLGLVDNGYLTKHWVDAKLANDRFDTPTIWNVLSKHQFNDWAIFWEVPYPPVISSLPYTRNLFPQLKDISDIDSHFHKLDNFFSLAKSGKLPKYSYIEPHWGGYALGMSVMGDEYHPPSDTTPGEHLLARLYHALRTSPCWEKTLLVITFDEHGGTYDHVPPGPATPPTGKADPGQYKFTFDRFGVRVPTILVSPLIEANTVFRSAEKVPYDHTSVIATILKWALPDVEKADWGLGDRVLNAPTFDAVLTLDNPRSDDVLAPMPASRGTPLKFGDPFYLRHMSGEFISKAYVGKRYYYPTLTKNKAVPLDFRFGFGVVKNNAVVQLRTAEYLEPLSSDSPYFVSYPAIRNFLGAWKDDHDCYYYSTNDAENYAQQYWQLAPKDGAPGAPICYGDRVYIASHYNKYQGQRLKQEGEYVSTKAGVDEWWSVEPNPQPRKNTPDVVQYGDRVHLKHMSGEFIGPHDRAWPQLAHNAIQLHLLGGVGDLSDGITINIATLESGMGGKTILGAFADSHDCYYWSSGYEAGKQAWQLRKVEGKDPDIHYGDKVFVINLSYTGQKLTKDKHYVTTSASSKEWWVIEKG